MSRTNRFKSLLHTVNTAKSPKCDIQETMQLTIYERVIAIRNFVMCAVLSRRFNKLGLINNKIFINKWRLVHFQSEAREALKNVRL